LLAQYPTLEAALADGRFASEADALRLYRRIAAMDPTAPVPDVPDRQPDWNGGAELVRGWGLNQLADRLNGLA
jgi:hypothetical protein